MSDVKKYTTLISGLIVPLDLKPEPIKMGFFVEMKPMAPENKTVNEKDGK